MCIRVCTIPAALDVATSSGGRHFDDVGLNKIILNKTRPKFSCEPRTLVDVVIQVVYDCGFDAV